jgi:hypothetical protein
MIVTGVIGCIFGSIYLKRHKVYKRFIISGMIGTALALSFSIFMLNFENLSLALIGNAFIGFTLFPIYPALNEFACEIVFPIGIFKKIVLNKV